MTSLARRLASLITIADPDVRLWRLAVIANGGWVSPLRLAVVAAFVAAEKASGAWSLTDDYWIFWAENAIQALTSLKQRRLAVAVNSPVFTPDRDWALNGTTSYIDTGFIPSSHAVAMGPSSIHAEVYERTNTNSANDAIGTFGTTSRVTVIGPRNGNNMNGVANSNAGGFALTVPTSVGLSQVGRTGATLSDYYGAKDGIDLVNVTPPTVLGPSLSPLSFFVGGSNNGSLVRQRACQVGYLSVGAALSGAQRLARSNNVQAWKTSVGA